MKRLTIGTRACTEILALLVHLAWADKKLAEQEKTGLRAAAGVFNLSKQQRERLDQAMKSPLPLDQILLDTLSPRDQAFAYVAAAWLTGVDQDIDPREQDALDNTAAALGLDAARKQELTQIARDLPAVKDKGSWGDALVTLFKSIPARLEAQPLDQVEVAFEDEAD
ncbi:MAG: DUF533 domain-containing protein [Byssovorax sp.]